MKSRVSNYTKTAFAMISAKIACLFKISFIIGSQVALLSATSMVTPLVGLFGGILGSFAFFSVSLLARVCFFGSFSLKLLAFYVPGFFASMYLASRHWSIRLAVPLMCMILFVAHPIGAGAWLYSLYWLIPVIAYFSKKRSLFFNALGATFTAHAVGSIIWLYTVGMSASVWIGLIPVVACERLVFAAGMVVVHAVIQKAFSFVQKRITFVETVSI